MAVSSIAAFYSKRLGWTGHTANVGNTGASLWAGSVVQPAIRALCHSTTVERAGSIKEVKDAPPAGERRDL